MVLTAFMSSSTQCGRGAAGALHLLCQKVVELESSTFEAALEGVPGWVSLAVAVHPTRLSGTLAAVAAARLSSAS